MCRRRSAGSRRADGSRPSSGTSTNSRTIAAHLSRLVSARSPSISATATYALSQATYALPTGDFAQPFPVLGTESRPLAYEVSHRSPRRPDCDHSSMAENPCTIGRIDRGSVRARALSQSLPPLRRLRRDCNPRSGSPRSLRRRQRPRADESCRARHERVLSGRCGSTDSNRLFLRCKRLRRRRSDTASVAVRCCVGHARKRPPIRSATVSGARSIAPSQCRRSRKVESDR